MIAKMPSRMRVKTLETKTAKTLPRTHVKMLAKCKQNVGKMPAK